MKMFQNKVYEKELKKAMFADQQQLKTRLISKLRKPSMKHDYNKKKLGIFELDRKFKEENLRCIICQDYFQKFTLTFCGHSFCYLCIFEHLLKSHKCPSCFTTIKGLQFIYCKIIDGFIQSQVVSSQKNNALYLSRKKDLKAWKAKKKIQTFNVGDLVDILDTEHIWCVGKILNLRQKKKENYILVHYQGWNKIYDECISIHSQRLSPIGLFTNRKDILLYQPTLNENTVSNYVRRVENQQNQELGLLNYLILQQQSQGQNFIMAIESADRNTLSSLLSLVVYIREMSNNQNS
ncbi:unnamed protein product (macronuclear) [Paramecium tetraurelia]|uniref:RING-type domain-containing protein n=1 Tax=Paramecium tetraurelia TaxID=5888 RepID=A0CXD6_PARTE|nr:uncharacterized protein GSPATT00011085001 [Paramecium tetraurelia]CAK75453.1 unnamed protein product [Paramecium tetraurelia]|eukprot:XP_001442850.1 hypothetical protein (macronuclear) [Paramecium tetraurelia strain d4-2]